MLWGEFLLVTNKETKRRMFIHITDIKFVEETTDGVFIALEMKRGRAIGITVTESIDAINYISRILDTENVTFVDGKRGLFVSDSIEAILENSEGQVVIRVKNMANGFLLLNDFDALLMECRCGCLRDCGDYDEAFED